MRVYAMDTGGVARLRAKHETGLDLAFFRDGVERIFNATVGTIGQAKVVYVIGQST